MENCPQCHLPDPGLLYGHHTGHGVTGREFFYWDRDQKYDRTGTMAGIRNMTGPGPALVQDWDHDQEQDKD